MSTWEIRAEAKALHEIWTSGSTPCGADVPAAVTTILILVRRVLALVEIVEAVSEDCGITPEDMRSRLNDHFVALDHKDEDRLYEYILKAKAALAREDLEILVALAREREDKLKAALIDAHHELAQWAEKWDATIDTYTSLLGKARVAQREEDLAVVKRVITEDLHGFKILRCKDVARALPPLEVRS